MRVLAIVSILWAAACFSASAQSCPTLRAPQRVGSGFDDGRVPSARQTLSGTIVYHNDLRVWFALHTDTPVCGQTEFPLWPPGRSIYYGAEPKRIETLRGCKASITGRLEFADSKGHPNTIYVSIGDRAFKDIVPDRACVAKPEFLDTAKVKPAGNVDKYIAKLTVSLVGDGSVVGLATSRGRVLRPWQAYMTYEVQDNLFLTATCGYGFAVGNVSDAPEADVKVFDRALLDLNEFRGKASPAVLTYTCTRVVPPGGD